MYRQYGGQNVFRGQVYQQGYGLGGYFKKFFRWLVPIAEKHIMPHVKSGLETVGKQAVQSVANIAQDTLKGRDIREAAKEHATEAIENIKTYAEKKIRGEGIKRKRAHKPAKTILKKRKTKDIFD